MTGFADVTDLARLTARDPRGGARAILSLRLPRRTLWELLLLVSVLTDLLLFAELAVGGADVQVLLSAALPDPLLMAAMQFASLFVMTLALYGVGHAFGGKGDWAGAMALVVWLQVIMLALGLAQVVLYLLIPVAANLLGLVSLVALMWLLTHFTAELHCFKNLWLVAFGIVGTAVVLIFGLSFLLVAFGVLMPGVA